MTGNKILRKRGAISLLFYNIFNISLTSGVKLHIHLWNVAFRFILRSYLCLVMQVGKIFVSFVHPEQFPNKHLSVKCITVSAF